MALALLLFEVVNFGHPTFSGADVVLTFLASSFSQLEVRTVADLFYYHLSVLRYSVSGTLIMFYVLFRSPYNLLPPINYTCSIY